MSAKTKVKSKLSDEKKSSTPIEKPFQLSSSELVAAFKFCLLGWLVPGAGHWYLGLYKKGWSFFILLNGLFFFGMTLHGEIAIPILNIHSQEFNFVNILIFIFGCGNGLMTFLNLLPFMNFGNIELSTYEVGTLFMVVSGSLNVFVVLNAWDLFRINIASQRTAKSK